MKISGKRISQSTGEQLTFFQEVHPANRRVSRENEKEKQMIAGSGRKLLEQLERLHRPVVFSRILLESSHWKMADYLKGYSLHWKMRVIKPNVLLSQLALRVRHTKETGFGLLPSPCARDMGSPRGKQAQIRKGNPMDTLPNMMKARLLPTPKSQNRNSPAIHGQGGIDLQTFVQKRFLPTPMAISDPKGGCTRPNQKRQNDTLAHSMHGITNAQPGTTFQLNPLFVEEMMGFPENWILLPFLNGETKQLKHMEML